MPHAFDAAGFGDGPAARRASFHGHELALREPKNRRARHARVGEREAERRYRRLIVLETSHVPIAVLARLILALRKQLAALDRANKILRLRSRVRGHVRDAVETRRRRLVNDLLVAGV